MAYTPQYIWRYGDIDVMYSPDLDGAGTGWAPTFVAERRLGTVFEWCAGPAFISFALLAEGLCDSLCLADINPAAIDSVQRTTKANRLENRVRSYVSDNLTSVPQRERFDLVVGNPPNYCSINPAHPLSHWFKGELALRAIDPEWRIHAGFYSQIAPFLNPGAFVLVQEVEPHSREAFEHHGSVPLDIRPEAPATIFTEMMRQGGLVHVGDFEFRTPSWPNPKSWLQVSQKPA